MKYAFTLAALAFASVTLGAAIPKERPDCGSPFSPPCPPAEVEKRQDFIGFETGHSPRSTDETAEVPDCGSPFSPPCPPKAERQIFEGPWHTTPPKVERGEAQVPDCGSPPFPPKVERQIFKGPWHQAPTTED